MSLLRLAAEAILLIASSVAVDVVGGGGAVVGAGGAEPMHREVRDRVRVRIGGGGGAVKRGKEEERTWCEGVVAECVPVDQRSAQRP